VDLYADTAANPFPTYAHYRWSSASDFTEYIYISAAACPAPPCVFYAGVTPYANRTCSYTITVNFAAAPIPLIDGQPYADVVASHDQRHYRTLTWTPTVPTARFVVDVQADVGLPYMYGKYNWVR
jgi:hypothetical protein